MNKAIDAIHQSVVLLIQLFMILSVFGLIVEILYPHTFNLMKHLAVIAKTVNEAGFAGFITFILLIAFYDYVKNRHSS
jgi:hypothetical protein